MKKVVFSLGAVTAMCACGLVIDADKLVEGNASMSPGPTNDATTPDAGGSDASNDGPTLIEIPECVPAAPTGTEGPYAVTFVNEPAKAACPPGYLATPIVPAKGNLTAEAIVCGSAAAAGCTCAPPSGTATCSLRLRYFKDSQCTDPDGIDPLGASCLDMESRNYLEVETTVMGVTCSNTGAGTVAPTVKPTPTFLEDWVVCAPDPNVQLAQCKSDQVAVPPAKAAGACVITSAASCSAPYTQDVGLSKSGAFTDGRACACSCGASAASCTGGSATIYGEDTCSDTGKPLALDTCVPRGGDDGMKAVAPIPSGSQACAANVAPTGVYEPSNDLHLCCLP